MRKDQRSPDRQGCLVRCADYPHVHALLAPRSPRRLAGIERHFALLAEAGRALGRLEGVLQGIPNRDLLTRTLARREAIQSSQIEGTRSNLPQPLFHDATRSMDIENVDAQRIMEAHLSRATGTRTSLRDRTYIRP